jgi:hypothetical protein
MQAEARVGIFWIVHGEVITDAVPLSRGYQYGAALEHGGHWEYWEKFVPVTHEQVLLKTSEYDHYPRGRVVYFPQRRRFVVYADRCLWTSRHQAGVQEAFQLLYLPRFTADDHYRCPECGGPRL